MSDSYDHNYFHGTYEQMIAHYIKEEPQPGEVTRAEFDALARKVADLEEAVTDLEQKTILLSSKSDTHEKNQYAHHTHDAPSPGPVTAEMIVTDSKTLACRVNGFNDAKPPKPIIYGQFFEPRIRWDFGDHLFVEPDQVTRADGGHDFYTLVPGQNGKKYVPESEPLFVLCADVEPA
jgi:hypothetical protein